MIKNLFYPSLALYLFLYCFSCSTLRSQEIQWQKSLGGNQADFLYSIGLTKDGGYILGGSSYSGISGDKQDSCRGLDDYWIIKLDAAGQEQWQKTIGGSGSDKLLSIQQTIDSGYIVGGSSNSPASFEKAEPSRGGMDFWIIKLDAKGNIQWQKTIGGIYYDLLRSIKETPDGYILAGTSNSPKGLEKSQDNIGKNDYRLVKLDKNGNILWDKTIGGKANEEQVLLSALDALRKGLPKSMLTSYTYQPLVGVSSITPPNGITEYYIYDAGGRLKEIKNQQGQLLKSFEYNYKSQN